MTFIRAEILPQDIPVRSVEPTSVNVFEEGERVVPMQTGSRMMGWIDTSSKRYPGLQENRELMQKHRNGRSGNQDVLCRTVVFYA